MTALQDQRSASTALPLSTRLYNEDLAPTKKAGRTWSAYNIFTLWANDVHSLGNYAFAIGLFALGLGAWQILLAFLVGAVLLFLLLSLSGFMGEKTGVPFPVMSRIAFGIHGAQLAAVARGGVAIAWFGVQTYLASVVLRVMLTAMFPGLAPLDTNNFLGMSTLGWISFVALWILQVIIVSFGMEMIRKYEAFAGPVILVTMLAIAVWMFIEAGGSIALSTNESLTGGEMWRQIFVGGALWIAIYGTFVLNFCDFTRSATSKKAITRGNFVGIPLNMLFFGAIVVVLAGAQFKINGQIIESPSDIVQTIPNTFFLVLACLALLVLTVAVNLMANFVAPIYMFTNLFPRRLNFRSAAIVSAVIGLVILPWNLYNNPVVIVYFLGGLGAILGPIFGVIMADYWIIRKAQINVPDLYTEAANGEYHYKRGVNPRAIIALVPAAVIAIVLALAPAFSAVAGFSWFFGAGLAAVFYLIVADRTARFRDVDGEALAVASAH
ncbi:NCS1 family nucleobase:cation symporter-1 [Arthrobacter crystallopoietes]|uniref:Nucleobase:cation symporter-1, NCS1 family n=1 Tax=Crystallibacter crystallopoietes TaxID=37928 RepID=A0A1H1ASK8_9MICC|nr:NCS1 family nucleobase:cation symporter-1 [Arthrobacter crystallopoietes]AUI51411.1 nitrate reductase [Arthrobacter crystallopoietes]SDQ42728.1 nucleobase:cation symporter-1, NCS1 family [Arthrobacter crystallopoietes]